MAVVSRPGRPAVPCAGAWTGGATGATGSTNLRNVSGATSRPRFGAIGFSIPGFEDISGKPFQLSCPHWPRSAATESALANDTDGTHAHPMQRPANQCRKKVGLERPFSVDSPSVPQSETRTGHTCEARSRPPDSTGQLWPRETAPNLLQGVIFEESRRAPVCKPMSSLFWGHFRGTLDAPSCPRLCWAPGCRITQAATNNPRRRNARAKQRTRLPSFKPWRDCFRTRSCSTSMDLLARPSATERREAKDELRLTHRVARRCPTHTTVISFEISRQNLEKAKGPKGSSCFQDTHSHHHCLGFPRSLRM